METIKLVTFIYIYIYKNLKKKRKKRNVNGKIAMISRSFIVQRPDE